MRGVSSLGSTTNESVEPDEFTIPQYNKAIKHLLPLLSSTEGVSVCVALTVCLLFVGIEFLQKRYKTGCAHLRTGNQIPGQAFTPRDTSDKGIGSRTYSPGMVESWLFEAFAKLELQAALLNDTDWRLLTEYDRGSHTAPLKFQSIEEARMSLDALLCRCYKLRFNSREYY